MILLNKNIYDSTMIKLNLLMYRNDDVVQN
jgi:hypothetical protein